MKIDYKIVMGNYTVGDAFGGTRFLPQTFLIGCEGRIVKSDGCQFFFKQV
jgi:hypothetical protein